jgi:caa(3)-type oxidase subunit IV
VSTFVLLMSSLAMVLGLHYVKEGNRGKATLWILVVVVLGAVFMGFQFVEFREFAHEGLTPRTNIFGTTFFILTGIHGAHVTIGVIWMAFLAYSSHTGKLRPDNALDLEIAGLYWHFVDIVWIITLLEVWLFDVEGLGGWYIPILLGLSVLKFVGVVAFFMHLRFDHRMFTYVFASSMIVGVLIFSLLLFLLEFGHQPPN